MHRSRSFMLLIFLIPAATGISTAQPIASFPYTQNFEGTVTGWSTAIASGSANDWVLGTPAKTHLNGAHSGTEAYVTKLTGNYSVNHDAFVQSPVFDFADLGADPRLEFWQNLKADLDFDDADAGVLEYTTNGGTTWLRVDSTLGTGTNFTTARSRNWYNSSSAIFLNPPPPKWAATTAEFGHSEGGWVRSVTKLVGFAGKSSVQFRWRFRTDPAIVDEGWALDDVSVVAEVAQDAGVEYIDPPASSGAQGQVFSPVVQVRNSGTGSASFDVRLRILNPSSSEVYNQIVSVTGLAANSTMNVAFPSTWTAVDTGTHTAIAATLLSGDQFVGNDTLWKKIRIVPETRTNLTPDGGGYKYSGSNSTSSSRPAYTWVEGVVTGGTFVPGTATDDYLSNPIALPSPFTFYGLACDSIRVSTNGWLAFVDGVTGNGGMTNFSYYFDEALIPNPDPPNYIVAAVWDDLDVVASAGNAGIYTMQSGNKFVIQWNRFRRLDSPTDNMMFQIILDLSNNSILISYASQANGSFVYKALDQGGVGIEGSGAGSFAPARPALVTQPFERVPGKAYVSKRWAKWERSRMATQVQRTLLPDAVGQGSNYYFQGDKALNVPSAGVTVKFATNDSLFQSVAARIVAFLQGPYNTSSGLMNTTLRSGGTLSSRFPTLAIPSQAVDSINIEIRNATSAASSTVRAFAPAWLLADGSIRGLLDTTETSVKFDAPAGSYYIVVRHRNHLAIMTASAQGLNATPPGSPYNFTTAQTQAFGTDPMLQLAVGVFGMYAGDVNGNGTIKYSGAGNDRALILSRIGGTDITATVNGYYNEDVNMNGVVKYSGSGNDRAILLQNIGGTDITATRTTQVP